MSHLLPIYMTHESAAAAAGEAKSEPEAKNSRPTGRQVERPTKWQ